MIILEGCDGAGKTTLKEEILKRYPAMREGPRGTKDRSRLYLVTVPDTFGAINRAIRATETGGEHGSCCVWDRLYFSEMVYAPIVGRPCEFSPGQQEYLTAILEAMKCPIILCQPPFDVVKENAEVHVQMKGVNENLAAIYEAYDLLYWRMPNQTIKYDYTEDTLDQIYQVIDEYLHERIKREWSHG